MERSVYRKVDGRFLKINPDGSLIEVNFELTGCDVAITATTQSMVKLPDSKFVCSKSEFEWAHKIAIDINRAIKKNQSGQVKLLLWDVRRKIYS